MLMLLYSSYLHLPRVTFFASISSLHPIQPLVLRSLSPFPPRIALRLEMETDENSSLRRTRAHLDSDADGAVSRVITLSYAVTPLVALPVTAVLLFAGKVEGISG